VTLFEIARIYTDLVLADNQIPEEERISKEEIGLLRSKYHQLLMDKFREDDIGFSDRLDATRKAFELIKLPDPVTTQSVVSTDAAANPRRG